MPMTSDQILASVLTGKKCSKVEVNNEVTDQT